VISKFIAFVQDKLKLTLNTKQEIVARILLNEPRVLEFLLGGAGTGKTTLFDAIEAFAHNDPTYTTRKELFDIIETLEKQVVELQTAVDKFKSEVKP